MCCNFLQKQINKIWLTDPNSNYAIVYQFDVKHKVILIRVLGTL
jgi:hypothetical protein